MIRVRIVEGHADSGTEGNQLSHPVFVKGNMWVPVVFDDTDDPVFVEEERIEQI